MDCLQAANAKIPFRHQLEQHVKIKDTYVPNCAKPPIVQQILKTLMETNGVRTKLKGTRCFHFLLLAKFKTTILY